MTGNGIESDFVLPDSLFISDYSTLPSFYPHFGANCRFFCTISMSPDSSTLFLLPERCLWTPVRAIQLSAFSCYARVLIGGTQGALPLDSAKGSSTLWTPFFAIQLVTLSYCFRVFMREPTGRCPLTPQGTSSLDPFARFSW